MRQRIKRLRKTAKENYRRDLAVKNCFETKSKEPPAKPEALCRFINTTRDKSIILGGGRAVGVAPRIPPAGSVRKDRCAARHFSHASGTGGIVRNSACLFSRAERGEGDTLTAEEILPLFSRPVLTDAAALKKLQKRGFGKYLPVGAYLAEGGTYAELLSEGKWWRKVFFPAGNPARTGWKANVSRSVSCAQVRPRVSASLPPSLR